VTSEQLAGDWNLLWCGLIATRNLKLEGSGIEEDSPECTIT